MSTSDPPSPSVARAVAVALVVVAGSARWSLEAPRPDPERVEALSALHTRLFTDHPRPTGSAEAASTRVRIAAELEEAGCAVREQTAWSCARATCAWVSNLWCRLGPEDGPVVLGLAHTDSVAAGPGAADDGAGVVAWLDTVSRLRADPPSRPFVLLLTDGEELGLLGAAAFVDDPPFSSPIAEVVNLEARGTTGATAAFQTVGPPRPWGRWYASFARWPSASSVHAAIYERLPNGTDLSVFGAAGIAGVDHAFLGELPQYHTPLDDRAHLDPGSLVRQAELAHGWVRRLQTAPAGPPAAYLDLLGLVALWWPLAVGVPATVVAAFLALVAIAQDLRSGVVGGRELAAVASAVPAALLVTTAVAEAGAGLVARIAGPVWWGNPELVWATAACFALAGLASLGGVGRPAARHGAVLGWVAVGASVAAMVDGRLLVQLLPPLLAGLVGRMLPEPFRAVPLALALAVVWLPYAFGLQVALGAAHPAVVVIPLLFGLVGAAPFVPRSPSIGVGTATVAGLVGLAVQLGSTPFTSERPRPTAVVVTQRAGESRVLVADPMVGGVHTERVSLGQLEPPRASLLGDRLTLAPARGGTTFEVSSDVPMVVGRHRVGPGTITLHGVRPGASFGFDGVPSRVSVGEVTPGLPEELSRVRWAGIGSVPAHGGDRTVVVAEVR